MWDESQELQGCHTAEPAREQSEHRESRAESQDSEGLDPAEPEGGPLSPSLTSANKSSHIHTGIVISFCLILFEGHLQPIPRRLSGKESTCQCKRHGFDPWVWKIPCRRAWQPTPVLLSAWTEEPGRLQSMGWKRVRHDLATEHACTSPTTK